MNDRFTLKAAEEASPGPGSAVGRLLTDRGRPAVDHAAVKYRTGSAIYGPTHSVGVRPLTIDEASFGTVSGRSGLSAVVSPASVIWVNRVHTARGHPLVRG